MSLAGMSHSQTHRLQPQSPHHPCCETQLVERAVQALARESERLRGGLNASRRFSVRRPFEVFDVYRPALSDSSPGADGDGHAVDVPADPLEADVRVNGLTCGRSVLVN